MRRAENTPLLQLGEIWTLCLWLWDIWAVMFFQRHRDTSVRTDPRGRIVTELRVETGKYQRSSSSRRTPPPAELPAFFVSADLAEEVIWVIQTQTDRHPAAESPTAPPTLKTHPMKSKNLKIQKLTPEIWSVPLKKSTQGAFCLMRAERCFTSYQGRHEEIYHV